MAQQNKVTIDDENRFVSIKSFVDKMDRMQVVDPTLMDIKKDVVAKLKTMVIPLGQDLFMINTVEKKITDLIDDEIYDDIYQDDPVTMNFRNYLGYTKNYDLKKEQAVRILCEALLEIFEKITDVEPDRSIVIDGEALMDQKDRKVFEIWVSRLSTSIKREMDEGRYARKNALLMAISKKVGDDKERFDLANNILHQYTGEHLLEKFNRKEDKKGDEK